MYNFRSFHDSLPRYSSSSSSTVRYTPRSSSSFRSYHSTSSYRSPSYSGSTFHGTLRRGPDPTLSQIYRVAAETIKALKSIGVQPCFVGGVACHLYGNSRQPNDLDILCLSSSYTQEELKNELVDRYSNFYLVHGRSPGATYKVLWYHLTDTSSSLKVDLLFPGVLNIPNIPHSFITKDNVYNLPCAPLSLVFLLKLQAWVDHSDSYVAHYMAKVPMDMRDIEVLLPIAVRRGMRPKSDSFLPQSFLAKAVTYAERFVRGRPATRKQWEALGLVHPQAATTAARSTVDRQSVTTFGRSRALYVNEDDYFDYY